MEPHIAFRQRQSLFTFLDDFGMSPGSLRYHPHGFTLEHFTDGDLMNRDFGSHKQPMDQLLGVLWGPEGSP